MLYEALTGRLPFAGSALKLLLEKAQQDPPDPSKLKRGLPADLVALCRDLLARSPERRPKDEAILTRLGVASPASGRRSEEHTSELQSRPHLVCRLLLEKKKQRRHISSTMTESNDA